MLIVTGVLLVLALIADRVTAQAAQSAVATRLQGELTLADKPEVSAHGFPFPIVDWYYATRLLKQEGLVFIDDTHLMACFIVTRYMHTDWHWELVRERPIVLRTFMPDVGPRALAVGYPGRVSVAFDSATCRLGRTALSRIGPLNSAPRRMAFPPIGVWRK